MVTKICFCLVNLWLWSITVQGLPVNQALLADYLSHNSQTSNNFNSNNVQYESKRYIPRYKTFASHPVLDRSRSTVKLYRGRPSTSTETTTTESRQLSRRMSSYQFPFVSNSFLTHETTSVHPDAIYSNSFKSGKLSSTTEWYLEIQSTRVSSSITRHSPEPIKYASFPQHAEDVASQPSQPYIPLSQTLLQYDNRPGGIGGVPYVNTHYRYETPAKEETSSLRSPTLGIIAFYNPQYETTNHVVTTTEPTKLDDSIWMTEPIIKKSTTTQTESTTPLTTEHYTNNLKSTDVNGSLSSTIVEENGSIRTTLSETDSTFYNVNSDNSMITTTITESPLSKDFRFPHHDDDNHVSSDVDFSEAVEQESRILTTRVLPTHDLGPKVLYEPSGENFNMAPSSSTEQTHTTSELPFVPTPEQNYEVSEEDSVRSNGRIHGVQNPPSFSTEPHEPTPEVSYQQSEQNYEVSEEDSIRSNGRIHEVQSTPLTSTERDNHDDVDRDEEEHSNDSDKKKGYVVEGRNYKKYRVEEETSDGFIVGEYGVVSHNDGSMRGVRYTAERSINPRLIYNALLKFLSLQ